MKNFHPFGEFEREGVAFFKGERAGVFLPNKIKRTGHEG